MDPSIHLAERQDRRGKRLSSLALLAVICVMASSLFGLRFADWKIKTGSPRPDRPCASLAVDSENKTIGLVPIPDL